mmetsp:Transcript_19548/g.27109  ORF Transcript_19548/g.27109 Transcript_19548/m.27109 type:complete len:414 (-) Transcript_19548:118-1359(-)
MCCCCPPAINALFCLWVQSGFSKGSVASALTFFPPEPAFYKFQRKDKDGNLLPDESEHGEDSDDDQSQELEHSPEVMERGDDDDSQQLISPTGSLPPGQPLEKKSNSNDTKKNDKSKVTGKKQDTERSPAQQLTDRSKELRQRGKRRNVRDALDAKNGVTYTLLLDPRISVPPRNGGMVQAVKVPSKGSHVATIIYRVPQEVVTPKTKTIIISHGNATDCGAMHVLQAILVHSLSVNVVLYDYSGYGESSGFPLENATYQDISVVYQYTLKHVANNDPTQIVLYGQSVGSGPSTYLCTKEQNVGGLILHSPLMSGMRVLTPSRALACLDIYPNINRIKNVNCPTMVIHGRLDEEVSVSHGVAMHNAVPEHLQRDPWWVPDRGHNDITEGPGKMAEYIRRLRAFLTSLDEIPLE